MAEMKCVYDPLVELMNYYAGKKGTQQKVDTSSLPVEERLKQRIIDGDQIGIDSDLSEALKHHDPLTIINEFLLDGMKVVGELFGSGQMQLPFVLQSAETMKTAVAFLEPYMEKTENSSKGIIVLATVKGDVHDIGKNLVDIILTNNGYKVYNLGIKIPVDAMIEAAAQHNADAIGMSGLLVKSTLIMKENLQLMNGRGMDIPVILGGAALTRKYVEQDLREIYGNNVLYASDAFDGLHYMERIAGNHPLHTAPAAGKDTADTQLKKLDAKEVILIERMEEEDVATVMSMVGSSTLEDGNWYVARLNEAIVGCGCIVDRGTQGKELTGLFSLNEANPAILIELVRTLREHARATDPVSEVFLSVDTANEAMLKFYRGMGFVTPDQQASGESITLYAKPQASVDEFKATGSSVARNLPVPVPPFYGTRIVSDVRLEKVYEYINEVALIRGQWQVRKGSRSAEEYNRELTEVVQPKLAEMKLLAKRESLLQPGVIYGYYPCRAEGDDVVVYKPRGLDGQELFGEWNSSSINGESLEEWQRFTFPRQADGRRFCIADFFRTADSGEFDVVSFQIVTMGERATEYSAELFRTNNYADYLYFHGLSVECAEALAEYWHKVVRAELGIGGEDATDIRRLFSQGYRGSRYSFGYPACPNLEDQQKLFAMMEPERIGIRLSEEYMLEPEQSTSAIVVHHPDAKYFMID